MQSGPNKEPSYKGLPSQNLDSKKNLSFNKNTERFLISPIIPSIKLRRSVTEFPKNSYKINV
jgi:hypothetical protein